MRVACLAASCLTLAVSGADLSFSDPANVPPPPAGAVGQALRTQDLDVLQGFVNPPPGFGEVAFHWWLGDPLTKERLQWQIDQLAGKGVSGLQINYAHDDEGGLSYGLTFPSEPPLFSEEWWTLTSWFLKAAKEKGISISLSDYTLGTAGQGSYVDELLLKAPQLRGSTLRHVTQEVEGGKRVLWGLPENTLSVVACPRSGKTVLPGPAVDLHGMVSGRELAWDAPSGDWQLIAVSFATHKLSLDPMHREVGEKVIEVFFQRFEDRNPGEGGKGLNFFFSDELQFGVSGRLWNSSFADEFKRRKGYDLVPELAALFVDTGPRTPKVRLDYSDVMVALQEEGFFKPVFDWHQRRGMIYGCDHGGRGRVVDEFGDYFRTQRWNQGPGADQPRLGKSVIKAKVAASIAHLYERPRVWLEGYYGSGWGTSSGQIADATFANFAMGFNLLTLHGLYYSTHGGWWEWAPPCNHFRMPYWQHMGGFMRGVQRLSYVMSQGHHRCDVAIVYPVASKEAGMGGDTAVKAAFETAENLYAAGIDLDFIDFESLARAEVKGGRLHVSGEIYRALVIPSMQAVRFSTLQKAVQLQRAGGLVILQGALPVASERQGRDDAELNKLVEELQTRVSTPQEVRGTIEGRFARDYTGLGYIQHRRIGPRDVYMIYGADKGSDCVFRATGNVEVWDPMDGSTRALPVVARTADTSTVKLPLSADEVQLIVFSPGTPQAPIAEATTKLLPIDGAWEFEIQPVLDNRFGDFHWPPTPALIGVEARQMEYSFGATNESQAWQKVTCSFGPQFWKLGPVPEDFDEGVLIGLESVDPKNPVEFRGKAYKWVPYEFSWRWGKEGDAGHQGYHGLKGNVTDEFLCLGAPKNGKNVTLYGPEPDGTRYYLWTSVPVKEQTRTYPRFGGLKPALVWVNHRPAGTVVNLEAGANPLLVRYDKPGRGYFVLDRAEPVEVFAEITPRKEGPPVFEPKPLAMTWWTNQTILPFDAYPHELMPTGHYRFTAAPGLRALKVSVRGAVRIWVGGQELQPQGAGIFNLGSPAVNAMEVVLKVQHERGAYGGAAFLEYIQMDCGPGRILPGDWSAIDGLRSYSGGAWYRKTVSIPRSKRVWLDLGNLVSSAEVKVNGKEIGVRVFPPWKFDITQAVRPGENRIEVLVYNTLANHYTTIPTSYRGSTVSGLLGPVRLEIEDGVQGR